MVARMGRGRVGRGVYGLIGSGDGGWVVMPLGMIKITIKMMIKMKIKTKIGIRTRGRNMASEIEGQRAQNEIESWQSPGYARR